MITFGAEAQWRPIDVLAAYERVSGELQVRTRVKQTLNDAEPELLHLRNVSVRPLLPGPQALNDLPEASLFKGFMGVVVPILPEPIATDEIVERVRRHVLIQCTTFVVQGMAEFPAAVDHGMHREQLLKARFFPIVQASVCFVGGDEPPWQAGLAYINRDLVVALFMS